MPPLLSITSKRASVSRVNSAPWPTWSGSLRRSWRVRKGTGTGSLAPSRACRPLHACLPLGAQPVLLVAAEPQRDAAMGAELVHDADAALRIAKRDQPLAEQLYAHRRTVGLGDFPRQQRRNPITPHQRAHRRAGAGEREEIVLLAGRHGLYFTSSRCCTV